MRKKPERVYKQRPFTKHPEPGSFRGMSAERVRQASMAIGCDPEDVTTEEWDALNEYLALGGNPAGL